MNKKTNVIKIREFAFYLKDFGLLNDMNINEFLKTFMNLNENEQILSNNLNDINIELIYLKENLAKAMLEFFNSLTEEKKRIIYLNMYSKFLQKREKDLSNKGDLLYKSYCSLNIKKFFVKWKDSNINNAINRKTNNQTINKFLNLQQDNFCFNIISDNNNNSNSNNNIIINSNNHKIIFKKNTNNKLENRKEVNPYSDINSLILTTKSTVFNSNNNIILHSSNFQNKLFNDKKLSKNYKYQTIDNDDKKNIIFENFEQKIKEEKKEIKKRNSKGNKSQVLKSSNKSLPAKNKNNYINNDNQGKKVKKQFISLIEKEKTKIKENNIQTIRKTYNSNRPISNFNYDEYNKKNVYRRLYEQTIEQNKRKEKRIEDNLKEIKERSNHPTISSNSFNKYKNPKKNNKYKDNNNNNKYTNRNKINLIEKGKNNKENFSTMENFYLENETNRLSEFQKKNDKVQYKNENEKMKRGQNFMENQKKCIQLYDDIIKCEEKKIGKKFDEKEKENFFKELLIKMYKENISKKDKEEKTNDDILDENNLNSIEITQHY